MEDQTEANSKQLEEAATNTAANNAEPMENQIADIREESPKKASKRLKLNRSEEENEVPAAEMASEPTAESAGQPAPEGESPAGRSRRGRQRRPRREPHTPSENPMSLTELKNKSTQELIDMAREMGLENIARSRKQDIIFALLKRHAKSGEDIWGDGILEILQDGFGF